MHPYIENFTLDNFKNYQRLETAFSKGINCITGLNGVGKTNLLDAIYCISICKSYFPVKDADLVRLDSDYFRITANCKINDEPAAIAIAYQSGKRKQVSLNDNKLKRLSEHLGVLPVIFITPDDIQLLKGYSTERRKVMDQVLCQVNKPYLHLLGDFQKILKQRNSYLKQQNSPPDHNLLDSYDDQINSLGTKIFDERVKFLHELSEDFRLIYSTISNDLEEVAYEYVSDVKGKSYLEVLKAAREKDIILKRTTVGIQRDEIQFFIKSKHAKLFGSQGQQKNFLIAFKLACARYIHTTVGKQPLLLHTDTSRMLEILNSFSGDSALFEIENENIRKL